MITLKQKYTSKNGRVYWLPVNRSWKTRRGAEQYRDMMITRHPGVKDFEPDAWRIEGEEEPRPTNMNLPEGQVQVGDIFHLGWGYSMSLNDFYEVVEVSKTGRTCTIRGIRSRVINGEIYGPEGGYVRPQLSGADRFTGEPVKGKRISMRTSYDGKPVCSINMGRGYGSAFLMTPEDYEHGFYECHWD